MESKEQFIHAFMVSDVIQYLSFKVIIFIGTCLTCMKAILYSEKQIQWIAYYLA